MGLIKRIRVLESEVQYLNEQLNFLRQTSEKNERKIASIDERISSVSDSQKEIIEQNKKSQEDRTILLREYLNGGEDEE